MVLDMNSDAARLVFLFGGIGDQFLWLSLLPEFRRQSRQPVVAVTNRSSSRQIADLFSGRAYDRLEVFEQPNLSGMPPTTSHFQPQRIVRASHIFYDERERYDLIGRFSIGIADLVRLILDIAPDAPVALPNIPDQARRNAANYMREWSLPVGRTVLLAPWALSWRCPLPLSWWTEAVRTLNQRGFTVVSNVGNSGRCDTTKDGALLGAIPGTLPVNVSLSDIIPFTELCGYFLGMRSGLCDLIAHAQVKKLVIYPYAADIDSYLTGLPFDIACRFWSVARAFGRPDVCEEMVNSEIPFAPSLIDSWLDK
ncbi:MAG: hypothetical protein F8N37_15090 [Telmatospirillum sp.]|nr:hypothetical protein [Telmatospirillum sp.]